MTIEPSGTPTRRRAASIGPMVALVGAILVLHASALPLALTHRDEVREAEIAREMSVSGPSDVPRLNAEPYLEKPPLTYWTFAAARRVLGGGTRGPARAVAFGSLVVLLVCCAALGWRLTGSVRGALLAAGGAGSVVEVAILSRRFLSDGPLVAAVAVGIVALADARPMTRTRGVALGLAAFVAFLAKGPAGPLLLGAFAIGAALEDARAPDRTIARTAIGPLMVGVGTLAAAVLWLSILARAPEGDLVAPYLAIQRGAAIDARGSGFGHARSWWFYLATLPVSLLPWTPLLGIALVDRWRRRVALPPEARRILIGAGIAVALLTFASARRQLYLAPLLGPLAVLALVLAAPDDDHDDRLWRLVAWLALATAIGSGVVVAIVAATPASRWLGLLTSVAAVALGVAARPSGRLDGALLTVTWVLLTEMALLGGMPRKDRDARAIGVEVRAILEESDGGIVLVGHRWTERLRAAVPLELDRCVVLIDCPEEIRELLARPTSERVVVLLHAAHHDAMSRPGRIIATLRTDDRAGGELVIAVPGPPIE